MKTLLKYRIIRKQTAYCGIVSALLVTPCLNLGAQQGNNQCSFQGIGKLPNTPFPSFVNGMSHNGTTVVGGSGAAGDEAFFWTSTSGMTGLGDLPGGGFASFATGASFDGSVVVGGGEYSTDLFQAYRWTQATGMVGLGFLPTGAFSHAIAVSDDGTVVVGQSESSLGTQAFRWTAATGMVGLGHLPGGNASEGAFAMSSDGSVVVGGSESALGSEAFRWTAATGLVSLGNLSSVHFSIACATSVDGAIVFGGSASVSSNPNYEAFIWTEASGMVGLGDLPGGAFSSLVYSCSGDGSIAIGTSKAASGDEAFIWDSANGMRSLPDVLVSDFRLDLSGWVLTHGVSISSDGKTITGSGINPNGEVEGWIARINCVPTIPAVSQRGLILMIVLFLTMGAILLGRRRRGMSQDLLRR